MNEHTRRRRTLAARVVAAFADRAPMQAAILVGSSARDQCDPYSDIDMTAFYATMPGDEQLAAARAALGASELKPLPGGEPEAFAESFVVDGLECQIGHTTLAQLETLLDDVLARHETEHDKHVVVGGIREALPLHGAAQIASIQARVAHYPDELAQAMVRAHLRFPAPWFLTRRVAGRDATLVFHQILLDLEKNLLGVLLGLNRLYPEHDYKRLGNLVARMPIAPADFAARLEGVLRAPPADAVAQLYRLIDETFELVEIHMPAVSTAEARARLRRADPNEG